MQHWAASLLVSWLLCCAHTAFGASGSCGIGSRVDLGATLRPPPLKTSGSFTVRGLHSTQPLAQDAPPSPLVWWTTFAGRLRGAAVAATAGPDGATCALVEQPLTPLLRWSCRIAAGVAAERLSPVSGIAV